MKKTLRHVEYLLQSHDCVIIPGLGAVLGHGTVAHYDEKQQTWMPPKRVLSFNPELSRTDGLLATSVARRDGISIEAANSVVKSAVEQMRRIFESEGALELGKIGKLTFTEHGSMAFETADTSWLSPDTLWLPEVSVNKVVTASQLAHKHERVERRNENLRIALRRTGQIAASIAVILILGFMVKTGMSDIRHGQFASLAPIKGETIEIEKPVEACVPTVEIAEPEILEQPAEVIAEPKEEKSESVRFNDSDKYFLIVASLANQAEADKYIKNHSEIKLGILASDGRFRAYAATGRTLSEAFEAAKNPEIQSRYASTWVCRR